VIVKKDRSRNSDKFTNFELPEYENILIMSSACLSSCMYVYISTNVCADVRLACPKTC
jgi:hypothetical protein